MDDLKEKRGWWRWKEEILDLAVCGELPLEEAVDLSLDRLRDEWIT